jgi:transitional endoplasmic reticulum ATPase
MLELELNGLRIYINIQDGASQVLVVQRSIHAKNKDKQIAIHESILISFLPSLSYFPRHHHHHHHHPYSLYQHYTTKTTFQIAAEEPTKKKKKSSSTSNKSSKKKKVIKPDATSKAANKETSARAPSTDLSQAILNASKSKNAMKVYSYAEDDSGHSVVGMTESAMLSLGVFDGDTVFVKGKRGKKTVATVAMVSDGDAASLATASSNKDDGERELTIGMTSDAMKNAGVRAGDSVKVTPAPDVKFGKNVLILPYEDSIKSVSEEDMAECDVFDSYIRPYFEGKFRTLFRGDSFTIDGPVGLLEFQCVEIDTVEVDGDTACVVVDDTVIESDGEPVERDESDLDGAGYDTIGGASKHLAAVRELVELPLKHPELWSKLGINPPRGVLLTGPSGCGKTAMARAVAAETGAYFFVINGPEVISKKAGESETNLRRAFEDAAANAEAYGGAIIFIDEIDSIAPNREKTNGEVERRVVAQLLTLMDGVKGRGQVVCIGATNRPNSIDPALRRFGRFDREIDIGVPDEVGRMEILRIHTKNMKLSEDVDLAAVAKDTHGFVGSDMAALCSEAALQCIREKMDLIDIDDDTIDAEVLEALCVTNEHFKYAQGHTNPSSLRETVVEIPNVTWDDIGGLEETKKDL